MLRFMLASSAGSGAGIPARMAGFSTGAITWGSETAITWGSDGAMRGAAMGIMIGGAVATSGVGMMFEGAAAIGDGTMLDGVTRGARGMVLTTGDGAIMLMAATESARAAGSGGGIPASTEGSRAGEADTS